MKLVFSNILRSGSKLTGKSMRLGFGLGEPYEWFRCNMLYMLHFSNLKWEKLLLACDLGYKNKSRLGKV